MNFLFLIDSFLVLFFDNNLSLVLAHFQFHFSSALSIFRYVSGFGECFQFSVSVVGVFLSKVLF